MVFMSHLVLKTKEIEKTLAFYNVLGIEFREKETDPKKYTASLWNGVTFELCEAEDLSDVNLAFSITSFEHALAELAARDLMLFDTRFERDGQDVVVVCDPEGRRVELTLFKPRGG